MPYGYDIFGDLAFEGSPQCRQVQVAVDPAELLAASTIPAAHQRNAICPSRQRLTLTACSRHTEIIDSMALVERSVRARVGARPGAAR